MRGPAPYYTQSAPSQSRISSTGRVSYLTTLWSSLFGRGTGLGFVPLPWFAWYICHDELSTNCANRYVSTDHETSSPGFISRYSSLSRPDLRAITHKSRQFSSGEGASRRRTPNRIRSYSKASPCSSMRAARLRVPPAPCSTAHSTARTDRQARQASDACTPRADPRTGCRT